jgi:CDGSH-type Zn-finger protein
MTKGQRAGDTPIGVDVLEGKSYYWCTCGKSAKQPFCDGSHKDTPFKPFHIKLTNLKKFFSVLANKLMISQCVTGHITLNNLNEKY